MSERPTDDMSDRQFNIRLGLVLALVWAFGLVFIVQLHSLATLR